MRYRRFILSIAIISIATIFAFVDVSAAKHELLGQPLPEFTQQDPEDWLNSSPLKLEDLKGQVLVIDFWTFGCWNCYNSFPWLNTLQEKYVDKPFKVIGVHSPEFPHERDRVKVAEKTKEFNLQHPVMIDNEFIYWKKLRNRYWPSFYIVDKKGVIRGFYAGETHLDDSQARRIGNLISRLLKE